jgi:hypothetical protein
MTFARLYEYACDLRQYPVVLEGVIDQKAMELGSQDELYYVAADLDPVISLGHIKQYRVPALVYDQDPKWVTEIRYCNDLNECWKRYVCCKELMHIFDNADERVNCPDRFIKLLDEIESPLPSDLASPMYKTETRTMWMALAILCPEPVRAHFKPKWDSKELSDYDVALELKIPEGTIKAAMADSFAAILAALNPRT